MAVSSSLPYSKSEMDTTYNTNCKRYLTEMQHNFSLINKSSEFTLTAFNFYNITPTIIADKTLTKVAPYTRRNPNDDTTFD